MRFRGVIFDMGDVLYDATPWRRALAAALQREGVAVTYEQLVEAWEAQLVDVYRGRAAYWDRFEALMDGLGVSEARRAVVRDEARDRAASVQVGRAAFPGVAATLDRLRAAGVRLAVLSDTERRREAVERSLDELGLGGRFDAVVTSRDLGHVKPEPEAYRAAAQALGLPLEACAFVAHDVDELDGARAIGLFAVAFNHAPGAEADAYLDRFEDLTGLVLEGR